MKIARNTRLSLRKLFIAMLAVGPLAVLPTPVWAVLPTAGTYTVGTTGGSFTVLNGTVTVTNTGSVSDISFSDKAILNWGTTTGAAAPAAGVTIDGTLINDGTSLTNFNIASGQTYNFASAGSVLNKVTAGSNTTHPALNGGGAAAAIINGNLTGLAARVFVLANGNITVGNSAQIRTQSITLSTLAEPNDQVFIALGDLSSPSSATPGASSGVITLGAPSAGTGLSVTGNLTAAAGSVTALGGSVSGNLVLRSITSGAASALAGTSALTASNLSLTTNGGAVTQTNGITVAGATTISTGTGTVTLDNNANDFATINLTSGTTSFRDANIVTLGNSTVGGDLSVTVGGRTNNTAIATSGTVAITGNATFISASSANSSVNIANNSSVGGWVSGITAGGAFSVNLTGNLTLGNVTTNMTARSLAGAVYPDLDDVAPTITLGAGGTVTGVTLNSGLASPIFFGNVSATFMSPIASVTAPEPAAGALPVAIVPIAAGSRGSGYTAQPAVTIVGGGGTGAVATAVYDAATGTITGVDITNGGSNYTSAPLIVIAPPVAGAAAAQGRAVRDATTGLITGFEITNAGSGYGALTPPTLTFPAISVDDNFSSGGITAVATGNITTTAAGLAANPLGGAAPATGLRSGAGFSLTGANITTGATIVGRTGANSASTINATAGSITLNAAVTANRITMNSSSAGGNITQLATATITTGSNASSGSTLNAGNGTITLDLAPNSWSNNSPISITAGTASLRSTNNITISGANTTGNLTLTARPAAAGNRGVTLGNGTAQGVLSNVTVGGVLAITANSAGNITDNDFTSVRATGGLNLSVTAGTDAAPTVGTGNIVIDAAVAQGIRAEFGQVNASTTGAVSIAESTTLNLGNIGTAASPVASLRAQSTEGSIIDSGNIFVAATGNATFLVPSGQTIVIDGTTNVLPTVNLLGGGNSSITGVNSNVVLGNSTSVADGNITVGTNTGFGITLGSFDITGSLTVNSGSWIDVAGTANITGNLSLNATGNIPSAATIRGTGAAGGPTFGDMFGATVSINNTAGNVTGVAGSNLPGLSFATAPTVTITGGSIPTTAATVSAVSLNASGGVVLAGTGVAAGGAGTGYVNAPVVTIPAPPAGGVQATAVATVADGVVTGITITNAGSGYAAAPAVTIAGGGAPTTAAVVNASLNTAGEITGFTVADGGGGALPYNSAYGAQVSFAGATTTSITESTGVLRVSGTTSISSVGNALLWRANDFNNVVLNNSTGGAVVNDVNNLTLSGNAGGAVIARAGANGTGTVGTAVTNAPAQVPNTWALTLGNLNVNSLVAASQNGGGGNSGTLTQQSGTSIHSENLARFETNHANIVIGNNGNSFGRVEISAAGNDSAHTVTLVEDGTIKLGQLTNARGNSTITSRFGSIIEDPAADVTISSNGTLTATANNGSILIGNTTHTTGVTTANIVTFNGTAPNGAIAVTSNNSTTLGTINANSLTVNVTGGNGNITQTNALRVFGTSTFTATRNITLTNNANNFGRVFLTTSNSSRDIQITEGGTLNLGGVSMGFLGSATDAPVASTGNFTATSVSGDIIDTGLGGIRLGGGIAPVGVVDPTAAVTTPPTLLAAQRNMVGSGAVTLTATNGNIVLDDPTTDVFTSAGVSANAVNVTLAPLGTTPLVLAASNVTGNLTATSATGSILNTGALTVAGDAFFQSGSGDISVTNAGNRFGTLRFAGRTVTITEADDMAIVTGSSATGVATLTSGGNITITNRGGIVTLNRTAFLTASGGITLPKLIQIADTLTLTAAGTKDLSALSISSDLAGKSPLNLGSGTYLPPQP